MPVFPTNPYHRRPLVGAAVGFWPLAVGVLALVAAAYWRTFTAPFVFDDIAVVARNESLRNFRTAFQPPGGGETVSGRPLLNLSFALDHAIAGNAVWMYHLTNLVIHLGAVLAVMALIRLALTRNGRTPAEAAAGAAIGAALWGLHPLQTESVTYVAQRAESLAGLLVLLTVYGAARRQAWLAISACWLGLLVKETAVIAPVLAAVWVWAEGGGDAWHRRLRYALFSSWLLLIPLRSGRGDTAGWHTGISAGSYALTQAWAIPHYLRLVLWPHPLIFDYGTWLVRSWTEVAGQLALLTGLALATAAALRGRSWWGLAGVWFFAALAPSSSVMPVVTQTIAEHRMYLALAPLAAIAAAGILWIHARCRWLGAGLALVLPMALGARTVARNDDYRTAIALWTQTVRDRPGNARAHYNLATQLVEAGRPAEAIPELNRALQLQPNYPEAECSWGNALLAAGRPAEAAAHYRQATVLRPGYADAWYDWGNAAMARDNWSQAIEAYAQAERLHPDDAAIHVNYSSALSHADLLDAALAESAAAVRLEPRNADARFNRGNVLARGGRWADAAEAYREALRLDPGLADAAANLRLAEQQLRESTLR